MGVKKRRSPHRNCLIKADTYLTLNLHLIFQTFPFFGVEPTILNEHGEELEGEAEGYLVSSDLIINNFMHLFKSNSSGSDT